MNHQWEWKAVELDARDRNMGLESLHAAAFGVYSTALHVQEWRQEGRPNTFLAYVWGREIGIASTLEDAKRKAEENCFLLREKTK